MSPPRKAPVPVSPSAQVATSDTPEINPGVEDHFNFSPTNCGKLGLLAIYLYQLVEHHLYMITQVAIWVGPSITWSKIT